MKQIINAFLLGAVLFTAITLGSCREDSDTVLSYAYNSEDPSNFAEASSSFEGQFKAIWTAMNCNYPIWDYEAIDWDKVYDNYLPRFRALDERARVRHDSVTNDELRELYIEILGPLHDGHFYAKIKNLHKRENTRDISAIYIQPTSSRTNSKEYQLEKDAKKEIDDQRSYNGFPATTELEKLPGYKYACFDDNIVYLSLSSIVLSDSLKKENGALRHLWHSWFNKIQELHRENSLKGVIIDVRYNNGGTGNDYKYVIGALQTPDAVSKTLNVKAHQIGMIRVKSGIGRLDYLPITPMYHPLYEEEHAYIEQEPIVVLANSHTWSTAEHICLGAKHMSNGCVIGTQTGGAFSPLYDVDIKGEYYSLSYSGIVGDEFNAPFFLNIPYAAFFTNEGKILENIGVEPDIKVEFDTKLYKKTGRDSQLERALEYIRTGK